MKKLILLVLLVSSTLWASDDHRSSNVVDVNTNLSCQKVGIDTLCTGGFINCRLDGKTGKMWCSVVLNRDAMVGILLRNFRRSNEI